SWMPLCGSVCPRRRCRRHSRRGCVVPWPTPSGRDDVPYFTDASARAIIRTTYEGAGGEDRAVATALYEPEELAGLPRDAILRAFGVGPPVRHARLQPGDVVLDVGCGAGIDTLLAARRVTPTGRVLALDMTPAMVARTRASASAAGFDHVDVHEGLMEALP